MTKQGLHLILGI
jgi:hypothetical protein